MKHAFKKIMALLLAVAMIVGILPAVLAADELPFTDVKENDWFAPYVDFVYNHEPQLMNGMTEDTFEPQGTLTRAMAAVVLYRLADPVIPSVKPSTFTDLTADWYKNGIAWAQQNGVVNGISEDKFDPEGLVTREQLVTMIWRYNDSPVVEKDYLKNFPDASKISEYAKEAFNWAISKKIISGSVNYDDSITLNPQGYATRAEFAKIIAVFADVTQGCEAGHSWDEGVITVEPTCTEPGEKVYTCVRCDETMTEEIPAMGHSYFDGACYVCGEALAAEGDIVIYYTNDVHTYIDGALSYDTIADLKAQTKKIADGVLLVDAGDHIQGTAYGSMDKGETIIELMNAADYDLATLGNHEFDYGMERALELVGMAEFPYVSANFYHEKDGVAGDPVLDAYRMFEISGVKIALVGITTPESFTKSTPAYFQDENGNYIYGIGGGETGTALYAYVQAAINAAKEEGADYIIALGHCGDDPASQPWTSEEVIANTVGLDAFIDGHSHSTVEGKEVADKASNPVLLTQTGEYFNAIGKMTINEDGISTELITDYTGSDSTVAAIQDAWIAEIETKLGEVIGYAEVTLDNYVDGNRIVRKQETNTGDFAADALYYLFDNMGLDVDVAIMNGGGVRNKAITGEISYLTCKNIHTFGNVACLQTITGQQLLDALEWGARGTPDEEIGGFLHVSGITYEIHTDIASTVQQDEKGVWIGGPTGEYRVKNVMVGGEPLDLDAEYNLAGYNYTLRDLGDGFAMFDGAVNVLDYVMEDYQVLANYVKSFAPDAEHNNLPTIQSDSIYAEVTGEGRITLVSDGGSDTPDTPDTPDEPDPPATGNEYTLTSELKDGDKVVIYNAGSGNAFSSVMNGYYASGVAVTPANNVITTEDATIIWEVTKNADGTFTFKQGENVLMTGVNGTYANIYFTGDYAPNWNVTSCNTANNSYYIASATESSSYGPVYLEWYGNKSAFSAYSTSSVNENAFGFQFYALGGSTGGNTPDTPDDPNPPATGDTFVLSNELKAGDEVVIVCAAKNMALSSTYNGFYNAAVAVEPVDGVLTNPAAELVWTVGKNGDNYTFSFNGQNLGMADSYSSMPLGEKNDQWTISAGGTENTWFVFNVGRQVYIEYYETNGNWSGYYNNSVAELFELSFYVKGDAGTDTPDEPDTPDTPDDPNPPATGDDYVLTNELKAGDEVVIVCAAKNMALSSTYNGFYNAAVAVEPVDGVLTNPAAELVWTVGKNGDNYTFSFNGQNLGMADSYSSMPLGEKNDQWTISAGGTENTWFVFNVGRQVYIEYYETNGNWSGYYNNSVAELFELSFYVKGGAGTGGETPDTPDEPDVPDTPVDPNPPVTGEGYVLTTELKDGDQLVIYYPTESLVMSSNLDDRNRVVGIAAEAPVDGILTLPEGAVVFTVEYKDDTNFNLIAADGTYLTSGETGNSMSYAAEPNACSLWNLKAKEGTDLFYIYNSGANYNGNYNQAIEVYYSAFTTYGWKDSNIYEFQLYVKTAGGETPDEPDTPVVPDEPDVPVEPEDPDTPDTPVVGEEVFTLTTELKNGDQLVIYYPTESLVMSSNLDDRNRVVGIAAEAPVNGVLTLPEGAVVFTVEFEAETNDFALIAPDGTYLTSGETGNSMSYAAEPNACSLWNLKAKEGTDLFYIYNSGANYNGNYNQAIEVYYSAFTTYGWKDSNIYEFQLYVKTAGTDTPDTPVEPEDPDVPVEPEDPEDPDTPVEGVEVFALTTELKDGDELVIYYPTESLVMGSNLDDRNRVVGIATDAPSDDILTLPEGAVVFTVEYKDDTNFNLIAADGTYLTSGETGNSMSYAAGESACSQWNLKAKEGTDLFYIYNSGANYNGNYNQAMEVYYSAFTTYGWKDSNIYEFQLYVKTVTDEAPCAHEWDNGTVTTPATCTDDGVLTITCGLCGATKTETIAALGHADNDGDNACDTCGAVVGGDLVATAFEDIKATDTVIIVISGPVSGKDYVMFNTASDSAKGAGAEFDGETVDETMFWNIVPCSGGYTVYKAGSTSEWLYLTNANNGVRVGTATTGNVFNFAVPYEGQNSYLCAADSAGTVRYIGAYDNNGGSLTGSNGSPITFNFRSYAVGASTGVLSNIADQTYTFYVVGG